MWYIACCNDNGECFGFLRKDHTVSKDPDNEMDKLMSFKRKKDTGEIIMQINMSYALMPDSCRFNFRVTAVKA